MSNEPSFEYRELDSPPPLRQYVRCIWRMRGDAGIAARPESIIPDGCAELVLNLGDPFIRHTIEGRHEQPRALIAGQITRAITIRPSGRIDVWGVRFQPWGAAALLDFIATEMQDRLVTLGDVDATLERGLGEVGADLTEAAQFSRITHALTIRARRARSVDPRVASLVAHVGAAADSFTVRGLAQQVSLTVRRVQRIFADEIGLSPKLIHRMHRFQRAMAARRAHPASTWAAIAAWAGYHDHAHLVHDARDLACAAPSEILGGNGLTEAFLTDV